MSAPETDTDDGPAWTIDPAGDIALYAVPLERLEKWWRVALPADGTPLLDDAFYPDEGEWCHGWVCCAVCGHRWMAVRPAETSALECPACRCVTTVTEED
jgi:hypothetical protein